MRVAGIFVSYSRESETAVKNLAADVEALEHTVWFDQDLSGGKVWWDQILAEIRGCQIFMMALSPQSLRSVACSSEYGYAADLGKPILPILIADGVSTNLLPPRLSQIQFVDYRKRDGDSVINLARALKILPPAASLPEPLPAPPPVPLSYLGRVTEQIDSGKSLDLKDQSALVSDLRRGLRDPETADDSRALLERLRKRDDLFARIGDEIDELLEGEPQAPEVRVRPAEATVHTEAKTETPKDRAELVETLVQSGLTKFTPETGMGDKPQPMVGRLKCALIGAAIGAGLGVFAALTAGGGLDLAMLPVLGGAMAGAISANRAMVIRHAAIGAVLLGMTVLIVIAATNPYLPAFPMAISLGAPLGAVLGALIGSLRAKARG